MAAEEAKTLVNGDETQVARPDLVTLAGIIEERLADDAVRAAELLLPLIVALALIDLCDGRGGIVAQDREVIAQRGIAVTIAQTQADEADEFRAFDGIRRIIRKEIR